MYYLLKHFNIYFRLTSKYLLIFGLNWKVHLSRKFQHRNKVKFPLAREKIKRKIYFSSFFFSSSSFTQYRVQKLNKLVLGNKLKVRKLKFIMKNCTHSSRKLLTTKIQGKWKFKSEIETNLIRNDCGGREKWQKLASVVTAKNLPLFFLLTTILTTQTHTPWLVVENLEIGFDDASARGVWLFWWGETLQQAWVD